MNGLFLLLLYLSNICVKFVNYLALQKKSKNFVMHRQWTKSLLALKNASVFKKGFVFLYYNNLFLKLAKVLYRTGLIQNFRIEKNRNLILAMNSGLFSCGLICKHVVCIT